MRLCIASMMALLGSLASVPRAQAEIVLNTLTYTQNFDSLATTNQNGVFSGNPLGTQVAIPNLTEWDAAKVAGNTSAGNFIASDGTSNAGGLYSFGATGINERALGSIASGTNAMAYGFALRNNTGATINSISISFTQENWRSSTTSTNTIAAGWALVGGGIDTSNYLSASGFNDLVDLNLVGPAPVGTNGALNGNDAANQVARSTTLSGLQLLQGETILFRWRDVDDTGSDAGLAIDDFSLSVTAVPEPASLALMGTVLGVGGLLRLRRRRSTAS